MPDFSPEQENLLKAQTLIANLMEQIMRSREAMTGAQYDQGTGQWGGPLAEALRTAMTNSQRAQQMPRKQFSVSQAYNPFGAAATTPASTTPPPAAAPTEPPPPPAAKPTAPPPPLPPFDDWDAFFKWADDMSIALGSR